MRCETCIYYKQNNCYYEHDNIECTCNYMTFEDYEDDRLDYLELLWDKLAELIFENTKESKHIFNNYSMVEDMFDNIFVFEMTNDERKEKLRVDKQLRKLGL